VTVSAHATPVLDTGWDHPQPFIQQFVVARDDIDELEHTNNIVYVRWCQSVAWAHSASLGLDSHAYRELDRAMAIVRSEFDYLQASQAGESIQAATWIVAADGRLSLRRHFQVRRAPDGATLLRARMQFACIEISSGRPRRMPPIFVERYGGAMVEIGEEKQPLA